MSKIHVMGDLTMDRLKWNVKKEPINNKYNYELYDGYDTVTHYGGALLLKEMIKSSTKLEPQSYDENEIESDNLIESMCHLEQYNTSMKDKTKKIRIKDFFGFKKPGNTSKKVPRLTHFISCNDIVVIHDAGNRFRNDGPWPKSINNANYIIHKMSRPLAKGNLWNGIKNNPNLIVVIIVDDLRERGLRISKSLSWERTAYDVFKEMEKIKKNNNGRYPELKEILNCNNLIIRFGTDGAIHYQKEKDGESSYFLYFDPDVFEGHHENHYPGHMLGLGSAFISGLVLGVKNNDISQGIKNGLIISRNLHKCGFIKNEKSQMEYPIQEICKNIDEDVDKIHKVKIEGASNWKILESLSSSEIYDIACQIVKNGESKDLKSSVAVFRKFKTADRSEIESYHSIRNLIKEYLNKNSNIPLSIAVFGPPGSGKSFGVTEIAKTISDDITELEFNLSQFQSPKDLFSAFHMVQGTSLDGKIPLVFFDEFDSKINNENFGWLKYFLSPMNDGSFKQGDIIHPIGKCIFVFAGGTKKTFAEFDADKTKAKGSDFVSRLRGYVNILGIDRKLKSDKVYMIRRAMILRSILEDIAKNIFIESDSTKNEKIAQIDSCVLNALIKVPKYKHGVRSMKAIIEMSSLSKQGKFERSALPSSEQLGLHVDAKEFKKYLNEYNPKI